MLPHKLKPAVLKMHHINLQMLDVHTINSPLNGMILTSWSCWSLRTLTPVASPRAAGLHCVWRTSPTPDKQPWVLVRSVINQKSDADVYMFWLACKHRRYRPLTNSYWTRSRIWITRHLNAVIIFYHTEHGDLEWLWHRTTQSNGK